MGSVCLPPTLSHLGYMGAVALPPTLPLLSHMGAVALPPTLSLPPHLGALAHPQWCHKYPHSMQVHYAPTNPTTMAAPSHINLGSNLPFMAHLNLFDLARLTNDPIHHQTFWPPMPTKLPSDIPKFEGKAGECPQNHIMTFHLW